MKIYDHIEQETLIAQRSGETCSELRRIFESLSEFVELNGLGASAREVVSFVSRRTGRSFAAVANIYAEMWVSYRIIEDGTYKYYRAWADDLAKREQEREQDDRSD